MASTDDTFLKIHFTFVGTGGSQQIGLGGIYIHDYKRITAWRAPFRNLASESQTGDGTIDISSFNLPQKTPVSTEVSFSHLLTGVEEH